MIFSAKSASCVGGRVAQYDDAELLRRIHKQRRRVAGGLAVVPAGDTVAGNVPAETDADFARLAVVGLPGFVNRRHDGALVVAQRRFGKFQQIVRRGADRAAPARASKSQFFSSPSSAL